MNSDSYPFRAFGIGDEVAIVCKKPQEVHRSLPVADALYTLYQMLVDAVREPAPVAALDQGPTVVVPKGNLQTM